MEYSVRDGRERIVTFDGELLAEVTSERPNAPRWMELRLYKTESGTYLLEKVGGSKMVHAPGCSEPYGDLPRFQEVHPGKDPFSPEFWMCETCLRRPAEADITAVEIEEPRFWASWTEDPNGIIDQLYRSRDGARTLQRMSVDLLEEASLHDEVMAKAFKSVYVI